MVKKIIIGSRGSKLALLYAQKAKDQIIQKTTLGINDIEIKSITTKVKSHITHSGTMFSKSMFLN